MPVGSPLEIYTTVLAWHIYTGFWQLLASVGLIYAPFAAIIFRNLLETRKSASSTDVGIRALRVAEIEFYIALFVLLFFAAPTIDLRVNNVAYTHTSCEVVGDALERTTEQATYGATRSTYDEAIGSSLISLIDGVNSPKCQSSGGLSRIICGRFPRRASSFYRATPIYDCWRLRRRTARPPIPCYVMSWLCSSETAGATRSISS